MRIGHDEIFLLIESEPLDGGYAAMRVEAVASASGRKFTASHDRLMMVTDDSTVQNFSDFASLKSGQFETTLTENGWLRFKRNSHGAITVRYRIGSWKVSAAMEGEVVVEGEFANAFCREFSILLRSQKA